MRANLLRILAIDPGTRQMGIAILDGRDLIYYAVRDFGKQRPADTLLKATREALLRLIQQYCPLVLAYEKTFYVQSKSSALLQVQEAEIRQVARTTGLRLVGYAPTTVRKLLCENGRATKRDIAGVVVRSFPELTQYTALRGRQRKYWQHMFDAVGVALVCAGAPDRRNGAGEKDAAEGSRSR